MPTELTIEVFLDWIGKPVDDEFQFLSDSAQALLYFLIHLDHVKPDIQPSFGWMGKSELRPPDYPISQKITVYSPEQVLSISGYPGCLGAIKHVQENSDTYRQSTDQPQSGNAESPIRGTRLSAPLRLKFLPSHQREANGMGEGSSDYYEFPPLSLTERSHQVPCVRRQSGEQILRRLFQTVNMPTRSD
jgi:hypothetical protein